MAANRPKRSKPVLPPVEHDNQRWTLKEKRRIKRALLKFSPNEVDNISKVVETKGVREVKAYLELMEEKLKNYAENRPKEAAELWGTLASDLVSCEVKDYSEALSEVMAVAGHLETPEPNSTDTGPDYGSIYKYISSILAGEDLPYLGKVESSIVQDLMQGLINTIRTSNTTKQQEIMLRKYHLLTSKIDLSNTMLNVERCRKAINNDFSEFENTEKDKSPNQPDGIQTSAPEQQSISVSGTTDSSVMSTSDSSNLSNQQSPYEKPKKGRPPKRKPIISEDVPTKKSKSMCDLSQTSSTVQMTKTDQNTVLNNCNVSLGASEKNSTKRGRPPKNQDHNKHAVAGNMCDRQIANQPEPSGDSCIGDKDCNTSGENTDLPDQAGDCSRKLENIPKKPALFTLNPFCIPIDLLKFQPLISTEVIFKPNPNRNKTLQQVLPQKNRSRLLEAGKGTSPNGSKESNVEVICVDERQDVVRREKFIYVNRQNVNKESNKQSN